ncbi:uncharacterized protein DS421_15g500660 [Arachis hypogaea]|nr:uncharacterized protein DS421_15g500660 [Arachis hypogaea]
MVEQLLSARPPVVAQQAAQKKESFTLKLTSPTTWYMYGGCRFFGTLRSAWHYHGLCCAGLDLPVTVFGGHNRES